MKNGKRKRGAGEWGKGWGGNAGQHTTEVSWLAWKLEDERKNEGREEERAAAPEKLLVDWWTWIGEEDIGGYSWCHTSLGLFSVSEFVFELA